MGVDLQSIVRKQGSDELCRRGFLLPTRTSPNPPLGGQVAEATFQACLRSQSCLSPAQEARREMEATAAQTICVNNSTGPDPLARPLTLI